jgi:mannose-6-phosphate isomerase-like protein (cupin superfamily)
MKVEIRRFDSPDETRTFPKGKFEVVTIGGVIVGRARYEPGWKWSEDVGPGVGSKTCPVEHVVLVLSGRCAIAMEDDVEVVVGPGDFVYVPPGHDSWVVGEEPYVSLHFLGAAEYARAERPAAR